MAEQTGGGLDASRVLDLLWGDAEAGSRGPKPSLSVAKIVDAGVAIAEADGLAAVSMRRIAERLGFTTMSLYRHVPGKDELLELMVDRAYDNPPDWDTAPASWRDRLAVWAWAQYEFFKRRAWVLQVPMMGPPMGPTGVAWFDWALRAMRDTGLTAGEQVDVVTTITGFVRGDAQIRFNLTESARRTGIGWEDWGHLYGQFLRKVIDAGRYPALSEIIATGTFDTPEEGDDGIDANFEFGLRVILDGVEALVDRPARRGST
jgi:AcrR family transcriptional regulator